jgi:hypothetical protein
VLHGQATEDERRLRFTASAFVVIVLAVAVLCTGCGSMDTIRHKLAGQPPETQPSVAQLLTRADQLVNDGQPTAARDLYTRAAGEPGSDDVHAAALYNLARLHVDPSSGLRDYRTAQRTFERLLVEYPNSAWTIEARAWRATLSDMLMRQIEASRLRDEVSKLKSDLHARQAETTRFREEASKLKADLQRLKRIDLDLERRP